LKRRSRTPRRRRLLRHEERLSRSGFRLIAGVDEAGRGPLAGPVVAGAVILKSLRFRCRVDDSKALSASQRETAYREIVDNAFVGVGIVDEGVIDRINIYQATLSAMCRAVANLPVPPDVIMVDGNMHPRINCPVEPIVKGDSESLSIAAASIVAKVTRDRIMIGYDRAYPQYGFARHKGYGTPQHKAALRAHGRSPIHRVSFSF
jgi:ribonuclease HII